MQEAANFLALVDHDPEMRKCREDFAVIQKAFTKSGGSVWIIRSDIVKNFPKVA
jgi:hypothetical protein